MPSRRTNPSRYSPAIANSTIHAARKRSRVRKPHCSTWSRLARYFRLAARMTKPITTLTRAIQPPLRGRRFRYEGKSASRKNGSARPVANVTMPTSGRVPPPETEAASSVPTNGPTQANEASENVRPISSVPAKPPFSDAFVQARQDRRRNRDLERPQQAQSERDEQHRDERRSPRGSSPVARRRTVPARPWSRRPSPGEQHDDSQAEHHRLNHTVAPPARLPVEEVRHRDRDHGEHAGREDGGQPEAERHQQKRADALVLRGARPAAAARAPSASAYPAGIAGEAEAAEASIVSGAVPSQRAGNALRVVARLVARFDRELRRTRRGVLLQPQLQQERDVAFVGFGFRLKFLSKARLGGGCSRRTPSTTLGGPTWNEVGIPLGVEAE